MADQMTARQALALTSWLALWTGVYYVGDVITEEVTKLINGRKAMDEQASKQATGPRHPDITVELTGHDGNAFAVLGAVQRELRRAGVDQAEVSAFFAEATAGDYDHLLQTCMRWVEVA